MAQTIILRGEAQRAYAKRLIDLAPVDAVVKISEAKRTNDQNAKLWAMLSDVSRAKPNGLRHVPETWKNLFMHACGHAVRFEVGLDGQPFPVGFSSSKLTVSQMSELIEFIYAWCADKNVVWSDGPDPR